MKVDIKINNVCDSRLRQVLKMARLLNLTIRTNIIDCNRMVLSVEVNEDEMTNLDISE